MNVGQRNMHAHVYVHMNNMYLVVRRNFENTQDGSLWARHNYIYW